MSSIMTNPGAMTALQTLKATNKNLETTQGRISTGYRVSEAAHNAAYWSIATTMRSDNSAMSTVKDALGLGAAQVDIAYTAMDAVKDTIDKIKAKLVAASEPDVDKKKIQSEIAQLQNDLRTYASSATFSGGNWLDVKQHSVEKVVASFIRGANGEITLGTIDVDTKKTALINKAPGQTGLLEGTVAVTPGAESINLSSLGVPNSVDEVVDPGSPAKVTIADFDSITWAEDYKITLNISVNGGGTIAKTFTAGPSGVFDFDSELAADFPGLSAEVDANGDLIFTGDNTINAISVSVVSAATDGGTPIATGALLPSASPAVPSSRTSPATVTISDFDSITWQPGETFAFEIAINGGAPVAISVTADVNGDLDIAAALAAHFTGTNEVTAQVNGTGELVFTGDGTAVSSIKVSGLSGATAGGVVKHVSVLDLDITDLNRDDLQKLLGHVDDVLGSITTAASDLGAIKTRIASQQDFVSKIMDAVDRGIGQLVDADMEEESTKLQALQVQQQLGIQALSIANSNAQNILSLFKN